MTAEEIKVSRHLKFFGIRPHGKFDLLDLFQRLDVRVVVADLDGLKHFSVFDDHRKICFFDFDLTDLEFIRAGFASIVYHLLGGTPQTADTFFTDAQRATLSKTETIVRRIVAPEPQKENGADFCTSTRRHHRIANRQNSGFPPLAF